VVKCHAAHHAAIADAIFPRRLGLRLPVVGQRTFDVDSAGRPTDSGGFRGDLRALGERPSRRIGRLRRDLDCYLGFRRDHLLSHRAPLRYPTTLNL
jgi:hypothetical protein